MQLVHIGTLDETADQERPFFGTFDEYRFKPWVKLHTSGESLASKTCALLTVLQAPLVTPKWSS